MSWSRKPLLLLGVKVMVTYLECEDHFFFNIGEPFDAKLENQLTHSILYI
jgi:hypothetical protein